MHDGQDASTASRPGSPSGTLTFGCYRFDRSTGVLSSNGAEVHLPPRVLRVLEHLLERPGEVVSKAELIDAGWADTAVAETSLSEAVMVLRHALHDDPKQPTYIQTVHRRGYRFIAPLSSETTSPQHQTTPVREPLQPRQRLAGVALAAAAVVALVSALMSLPSDRGANSVEAALAFQERDWVLIADFENRTGNSRLDGTLEYALGTDLGNSPFVNVVPRERIRDALRLMRRPADATVDANLAKEICLRDGAIRALLTGRVENFGAAYLLSVELVDPARGLTVMSFAEDAEGPDQVLAAVRRLSARVREALGEALPSIGETEITLAKATTSSLQTLQLYTRADELVANFAPEAAAELLRQVVIEDPEFASAHILLAWAIRNAGGPREEVLRFAERALELSENATARERYFIRASYFQLADQTEEMLSSYEALLQIDPDHVWANRNLANYHSLTRASIADALPYQLRLAQVRPNSFLTISRTAMWLAIEGDRPEDAEPYVRRATELAEIDQNLPKPWLAWVWLYPAHRRWLDGDLQGVVDWVDRWRETLDSSTGNQRKFLARGMGAFYLALGMLDAAERTFQLIDDPIVRGWYLPEVERARIDDPEGVAYLYDVEYSRMQRERSAAFPVSWWEQGAVLGTRGPAVRRMARAGRTAEARLALAEVQARVPSALLERESAKISASLSEGEIALAEGRTEEAISLLQEGLAPMRSSGSHVYFRCSESLATAWEQLGNLTMAARTLEDASRQKQRTYPSPSSISSITDLYFPSAKPAWMRVRLRLAQLYRRLGRAAEARRIETELRALLSHADPDFWMVRHLAGLDEAPAG